MKKSYRLSTALLVLLMAAQANAIAGEVEAKKIDNRADEVLRRTADFYKSINSLSTTLSFKTTVEAPGIRREMWADYDITVMRPNKASIVLKDGMGLTLVSDGKNQTTYVPPMNKFTIKDAAPTLDALFNQDEIKLIDRSVGNMFFIDNLMKNDPYAAIQQDLTAAEYVGEEPFEGAKAHHLKLSQLGLSWNVWIKSGPEPHVLRIQSDVSKMMAEAMPQLKEAKMDMFVTFKKWRTNPEVPDVAFAFVPPPDAQKVASLFESEEENVQLVGKDAPDIKLDLLGGGRFNLEDHKGKHVVVLEFWASWCAPCLQGLPVVAQVAKKYHDKGVVFYSINQGEEPEVIQALMKKRNLDFNVALDKEGKIAQLLGLSGIPFTMVIGKNGKVQSVHTGLSPDLQQKLNDELQALVEGKSLVSQAF